MKTIVIALLAAIVGVNTAIAGVTTRPAFVQKEMKRFEDRYGDRFAWARMFGWGTGEYMKKKFSWMAWCNTDGAMAMLISTNLPVKKIDEEIRSIPLWGASLSDDGKETWICFGNDWFDRFCRYRHFGTAGEWQCDNGATIRSILDTLENKAGFQNMEVLEFLK